VIESCNQPYNVAHIPPHSAFINETQKYSLQGNVMTL
jgi:hypothetical protein